MDVEEFNRKAKEIFENEVIPQIKNAMKTTSRIDSEYELAQFLDKLQMANIEIPSNVTLEIDSPIFKSEFNKLPQTWFPEEIEPLQWCKYKGQRITFKSE